MFGLRGCCSVGLSGFASGCPWLSLYRVNRKVALIVGGGEGSDLFGAAFVGFIRFASISSLGYIFLWSW